MTNDFFPTAKIEVLQQRAAILRRIRTFFDDRDFFEVETPLLSHDIVVDRYLHPIGVPKNVVSDSTEDSDQTLWLQTSPEFGMKRLIAGGATAIYQICKSFRQSESGTMHNPEFTMLEWYRVGDDMKRGMNLLAELVEATLGTPKSEKMSYRESFQNLAGVDPWKSPVAELKAVMEQAEVAISLPIDESSRDDWLNLILSRLIEPQLGRNGATIVYDWPASQSALALVRDGQPPLAERFELYVDGVELANGYHELRDADELARRNSTINQQRADDGNRRLPESSRLLSAMRHGFPGCAGVALGVDRLVMVALGKSSIHEVLAFPIDKA